MNNVSQISKAKRLTEEEVHEAAEELKESGVRPSSIEIYKFLGRGSLTTITNFLKTWDQAEMPAAALPALIIPDALKKSAEQLILKIWAESQELAEHEINSQREALKQAEAQANEKIAEAEAFSEEQSKQIEALEAAIEALRKEKADEHAFFLAEEKHLQSEIAQAKKGQVIFEQRFIETEKQLKKTEEKITTLEALIIENKKFELIAKRLEAENQALKQNLKDVENVLTKENKSLIEKAAKLEGELSVWKEIKPKTETKKSKNDAVETETQTE